MPKQITSFVCQECGYDSPAYLGKCPECGSWNSLREFKDKGLRINDKVGSGMIRMVDVKPEPIRTVSQKPSERISTGFLEMDNVLGGGIVKGSATLLAGDPGIGKSTLLLQLCLNLAGVGGPAAPHPAPMASFTSLSPGTRAGSPVASPLSLESKTVLYVSGEESKDQVSMRAMRLIGNGQEGKDTSPISDNLLLLSITDTDQIVRIIQETKPDIVVIDSIQTVESENGGGLSGSVSQVRYATGSFIRVAKTLNIPVILVGHVTKEGMVAGPMMLSHMVDTVLFLEGEKMTATRILRSLKNRFGPVDEVGIFQMQGQGMVEVKNPEQIFLGESRQPVPGSALVVIMEGTRPFLIEIQSLVVYSKFPMPRRVASGVDNRRLELLLAVLQKHARLPLENYDVFVNVAGGIKVTDRAVDLAICLAVYSSLKNKALDNTVAIAEVGLLGELRKVSGIDKRIREAKKLGFGNVISASDFKTLPEVLTGFGYTVSERKKFRQVDERHFRLDEEEE